MNALETIQSEIFLLSRMGQASTQKAQDPQACAGMREYHEGKAEAYAFARKGLERMAETLKQGGKSA